MEFKQLDCTVEQISAPIKNAVVGGPFGSKLISRDYIECGIPVIRGQNMGQGRWVTGEFVFVSEAKADELSANIAHPGDIIFTQRGTLGQVAIVPEGIYEKYVISQSQMKLTADEDKADNFYLYYLFKSDVQQRYIKINAIRVGVPHTNLGILKSTPLKLPSLELQLKIAKILGSLDDKIELNRQTNQSLEQISQAIFKSWFVDFEPVKAKDHIRKLGGNSKQIEKAAQAIISGAVNLEDILKGSDLTDINAKIESKLDAKMALQKNEQQNELAETARLFPDSLVESELGLMPNGWGTQKLEQGFNITMGQSPPGHTYNENKIGMAFFQGRRDFGWRYPKNRVYCTEPKRKAKAGDTLLSVRAPVGDINFATIDCCIGRGLAAIRHKSGCEIYTYYSMTELRHQLQFCYSDGTVFNSINQKDLRSIRLIRTPSSIVSRFGKILKASESQIRNNKDQSVFLTELRDALLPKLLAGELKVNV